MAEMNMSLDLLPEDCIVDILSWMSPRDACQSSVVSTATRDAAESDVLWERFLPSDYQEIMSRLVSPLLYSSKKDLFLKLSAPLLIDGGRKSFSIDRLRNKKCYMLSARELSITWSSNSLYWCWKPYLESRFPEVAELVMVCWLEIHGKMNTGMLSPNTRYGAFLVLKVVHRAFGLDYVPSEVTVEVGDYKSKGTIFIRQNERRASGTGNQPSSPRDNGERVLRERGDGWVEIELGEFYNDAGSNKEVSMSLREIKGEHLKGGIVIEGIELRPL